MIQDDAQRLRLPNAGIRRVAMALVALLLGGCGLLRPAGPPASDLRLHGLFTDRMVLQRDMPLHVFGTASPGGVVEVRVAGRRAWARTGSSGRWLARLRPLRAGGPHALTVSGSETLTLRDVFVGEVWLCAGQSNMEMAVDGPRGGVLNAQEELAGAGDYLLRLFRVDRNAADFPQLDLDRTRGWSPCTSETVADFSAVAYFFGREIRERTHVPVGLIQSAWGGSTAEAWTSAQGLLTLPDFAPEVRRLLEIAGRRESIEAEYRRRLEAWEQGLEERDGGNRFSLMSWAAENVDTADWKTMLLPQPWEQQAGLENLDGIVWFQRRFQAPRAWSGEPATLSLGTIDDMDQTWVNGREVGSHWHSDAAGQPRVYEVPAGFLHAGGNTISVRVRDTGGAGGFTGLPENMHLARKDGSEGIPLAGRWRYRVGVDLRDLPPPPKPLDIPIPRRRPMALFNAMVAPLTPATIRGVVWYQGEANVDRAYQYRRLFPTLIQDWRAHWGRSFMPFLFVQLAGYREPPENPAPDAWAELREAQAGALALPATGMATAVDIGSATNLHPPNKQEVGRRLALVADALVYGGEEPFSGPVLRGFRIEGAQVRLWFHHVDGGLATSDGMPPRGFSIAGPSRDFTWALARIEGDSVVVWSAAVPDPKAVRYGWAANPDANLSNAAGLPAVPFRTDNWPGITVRQALQ